MSFALVSESKVHVIRLNDFRLVFLFMKNGISQFFSMIEDGHSFL